MISKGAGNKIRPKDGTNKEEATKMATDTKARGSRRKVIFNGVEITERQKEILELWEKHKANGASNVAQAVASDLGITPNAVYIAKKRVRDALSSNDGQPAGQPF